MIIAKNDIFIEKLIKDTNYKVFKNGKLKTLITTSGTRSVKNKWRYLTLMMSNNGIKIKYNKKILLVHRIIYRKFIGKLNKSKVINHKNYNMYDNSIKNLEMISPSENMIHRYKKSPPVNGNSKINFKIAQEIRKLFRKGHIYKDLMNKFKLSKSSISEIINKKIWVKEHKTSKRIQRFQNNRKKYLTCQPKWVNNEELKSIYLKKSKRKVVDHIIPIKHKDVCGLHVPWNLQYLSRFDNCHKHNQFDYTMNNDSWKKTKKLKKRNKSKF